MKKVITLAVALLLVSVLSVTAFAAPSITVPDYEEFDGGVVEIVKDANTDEVTYTADPDKGYEFVEWIITGVEGVDYEIVSGSIDGSPITIRPLTDKFSIEPDFSKIGGSGSGSDTSPKNGDFAATAVLAVAALGLLATKKYAR